MSLLLNSYYQRFADTLRGLTQEENQANLDFESAMRQSRQNQADDLRLIAANNATRGMAHSGNALRQNVDLRRAYTQSNANAQAQLNRFTADLARKRLEARRQYDDDRFNLSLNNLIGGQDVS